MRLGKNPYKGESGKGKAYIPKEVTVCMITFIPNFNGYYKERFEVLKISLASLLQNTQEEYDLLILDNGSCQEVKSYLNDLHDRGYITYLILSQENLGYNGALNFIFSAAQGKYIAYSDDDVFFHPSWLSASLRICKTFPTVGYVTACPVRSQYNKHATSTLSLPERVKEVKIIESEWKDSWDINHSISIGANPEEWRLKFKENLIPAFEFQNVKAWAVSTHFQFLLSKDTTKVFLPFKVGNIMSSDPQDPDFNMMYALDKKLDDAGYCKLTTFELFTEHLGNTVSERCWELINLYQLDVTLSKKKVTSTVIKKPGIAGILLLKILNTPGIKKIPYIIYELSFKIINWKQAQDKRKVSEKLQKSGK